MKNAGAVCKLSRFHISNELCTLATMNDLDGLTAWHVGGVDLDTLNYDDRTALHVAVAEGHEDVVRFLISQVLLGNGHILLVPACVLMGIFNISKKKFWTCTCTKSISVRIEKWSNGYRV